MEKYIVMGQIVKEIICQVGVWVLVTIPVSILILCWKLPDILAVVLKK